MEWGEALWRACASAVSAETPWRWLQKVHVVCALAGDGVPQEALEVASELAERAQFWRREVRDVFLERLQAALGPTAVCPRPAASAPLHRVRADDESEPVFEDDPENPFKIRFANASGLVAAFFAKPRHAQDWRRLMCTLHHWTTPEEVLRVLEDLGSSDPATKFRLLQSWEQVAPEDLGWQWPSAAVDKVLLQCRRDAVVAWTLVARRLFVVKDVARVIAKLAHADAESWLLCSSYRQARVAQCCSQLAGGQFDIAAFLLSFSAEQLAAVVNQRSMQLFCKVDARRELLTGSTTMHENVQEMASWFRAVVRFLSTVILFHCESWERIQMVHDLVADATARLIELQNYYGAMVLCAVVQMAPVHRLHINPSALERLHVLAPDAGYRELRRAVMESDACVPYVGIWLTELVFLKDSSASLQNGLLINVRKLLNQGDIVLKWLMYQNKVRDRIVWDAEELFPGAALLETIMEAFPGHDDEMVMFASLKLRPKSEKETAHHELMEKLQERQRKNT